MIRDTFRYKNKLLLGRIREFSGEFKDWVGRKWFICSHYDADGLSSAGILSRFLMRSESEFTCRFLTGLSDEEIKQIGLTKADVYVFLDMGSDQLKKIFKHVSRGKVFVIDHHQIAGELGSETENLLNPSLFGLDGGAVGCTSVLTGLLTYFTVKGGDPYYLKLGLVGAVGDLQKGSKGGINEFLINEGIKRKIFKRYRSFSFFKLVNSPIHKGICWNFEPYIPGLTGREDVVVSLLASANIKLKDDGSWRKIKDLSDDEKKAITERIVEYLMHKAGMIKIKSADFLETIHEFPDESCELLSTAESFSSTLNACGKMGKEHLALAVSMGMRNRGILDEVRKIVENRRISLRGQVEKLSGKEEVLGKLLVIDGRGIVGERFTGSVSTMYSRSPMFRDKVILVITDTAKGELKVSTRAPIKLVSRGLNLGKVLHEVSGTVGGIGGGHSMAAGASLPIIDKTYVEIRDLLVKRLLEEIKKIEG